MIFSDLRKSEMCEGVQSRVFCFILKKDLRMAQAKKCPALGAGQIWRVPFIWLQFAVALPFQKMLATRLVAPFYPPIYRAWAGLVG